jgi:four helix bundle protein
MIDFTRLRVWDRFRGLAVDVYRATATFPVTERFGLQAQMRRCAVSIPANISEACGRSRRGEVLQFLNIAAGSASELRSHLILSEDLGYLDPCTHARLRRELVQGQRMLHAYMNRIHPAHADGLRRTGAPSPPKPRTRLP